mmetsp:Transcript_598/g.2353  ORF Transcript_598/g.2353 Transcript_598/m.2353 type:complete len:201 (+) Transcript_598:443-1045(+)
MGGHAVGWRRPEARMDPARRQRRHGRWRLLHQGRRGQLHLPRRRRVRAPGRRQDLPRDVRRLRLREGLHAGFHGAIGATARGDWRRLRRRLRRRARRRPNDEPGRVGRPGSRRVRGDEQRAVRFGAHRGHHGSRGDLHQVGRREDRANHHDDAIAKRIDQPEHHGADRGRRRAVRRGRRAAAVGSAPAAEADAAADARIG